MRITHLPLCHFPRDKTPQYCAVDSSWTWSMFRLRHGGDLPQHAPRSVGWWKVAIVQFLQFMEDSPLKSWHPILYDPIV